VSVDNYKRYIRLKILAHVYNLGTKCQL
jgi:hypothetical protein